MKSVRSFKSAKKVQGGQVSIKDFLVDNDFKHRDTETHYQVNCPLCSDTRERLGIVRDDLPEDHELKKSAGTWHCFNCSLSGKSLKTLTYALENRGLVNQKQIRENHGKKKKSSISADFHKKMHEMAWKKKNSLLSWKYATKERHISPEAFMHFQLGSRSEFTVNEFEHLAIPYLVDGKCMNLKYRSLDPKVEKKWKWKREKGGATVLYNHDVLYELEYDTLLIAESELDAISLWCMGFKNVVGMTAGADAFQDLWYEQLKRYKKIYLVLDQDEAGQDGAKKISKRLGLDKCYNIVLPVDTKDPNDFLIKHGTEAHDNFKTLMKGASQFEVQNVVSVRSSIKNVLRNIRNGDSEEIFGYDTPWKAINDKLGPVKPGNLVIVAGRPKTGKSTWVYNWMLHLGRQNIPTGMYTCEMRVDKITWRMCQMKVASLPRLEEDADPSDILEAMIQIPNNMHFYYPQPGDLELEKVEQQIREMVQRYGIKVFFFDNLHFLCRGDDEKAMLDKASQTFKMLAENLGIVIVCLTHPKKGSDSKNLTNDDLKGSSSIFQDADAVLLLNRRLDIDDDVKEEQAELLLAKTMFQITARFSPGGRTFLSFNGNQGKFTDKGPLHGRVMQFVRSKQKGKKAS